MQTKFGVKIDDAFVTEGCPGDDVTVLGSKQNFLSHFCTFFEFNVCYSSKEKNLGEKAHKLFSDPEGLSQSIEKMVMSLDEKLV